MAVGCTTLDALPSASSTGRPTGLLWVAFVGSVHFLVLFALVFGPRIFGSFIADTLTATCVLTVLAGAIWRRGRLALPRQSRSNIAILILLIVYAAIVSLLAGMGEYFYVAKFARAAVNWIAVVIFAQMVADWAGETAVRYLCRLFVLVAAVHCAIVILQWSSYEWAQAVLKISGYDGSSEFRFSGFTWSFNATNVVNAYAMAMLVASRFRIFPKLASLVLAVLILVAMSGLGRTSFFVAATFIAIIALRMRYTAVLLMTVACAAAIYIYFGIVQGAAEGNIRLMYLLDPISIILGGESIYGNRLYDAWRSFFVFPDDVGGLLFGYGISGRGSIYVPSDVGYVLLIWGIGLVGSLMTIWLHLRVLRESFRTGGRLGSFVSNTTFVLVGMIFVVSMKEQELLVRHVVTALAFASWLAIKVLADTKREGGLRGIAS